MIKFTSKQMELLSVIKAGNKDGEPCTVYDIMELVSYEAKRDAILHSVKILIDNGYVERLGRVRRGPTGTNMTFGVTAEALKVI